MVPPDPHAEFRHPLAQAWQTIDSDIPAAQGTAKTLLAQKSEDAEAKLLLAACLRRQGKPQDAVEIMRPLIGPRTTSPIAWFEWGQAQAELGEDAMALEALGRAAALAPGFTAAWRGRADLLVALGEAGEAGKAYAGALRASAADPALAQAAAAMMADRPEQAHSLLQARAQGNTNDLSARHFLAESCMRLGRAAEAETLLMACLAQAPGFAAARHALAILFYIQRRFGEAAGHLKKLLDLLPHQPGLRILHAVCLRETGDYDGVLPIYEKMLAAAPNRYTICLAYGHVLKALGREAEADVAYRQCLKSQPGWAPSLYLSLADLKTASLTDADLGAMRGAFAGKSEFGRAQLHYAIGHALDQRGDFAGAFRAFAQGAALRRKSAEYDADETTAFVEAAKTEFTQSLMGERSGCTSAAPIFIVGLPRSGSTLVEQILASHPSVEATSELEEIGQLAAFLRGGNKLRALPMRIAAQKPDFAAMGEAYIARTQQFRRLGRMHFTDKMPGNVLHIGLIHLILPNARIIHVHRTPMAAGFAAFRQFFQAAQTFADFSYDLREIGRYITAIHGFLAYIERILPGRVLHISYEQLVSETEPQIRRLLDHCGLPFEASCLRFWETERAIQTPSAQQVRRPVFREGINHWRHYAPFLAPLRESLGNMAV